MNTCDCKHARYCKEDATQCRLVGNPWCKPDKAFAGLTAVMWLTLYHNGSTQPVGQSFQADPWCLGEPDQVAGGLRIWNVDDDLRIVASVTPLQLTEPPALRYADEMVSNEDLDDAI